jgi:DNA repair ATPase RecN
MPGEKEPKPIENFIGDMTFGITLESIQNYFNEIQEELEEINKYSTKEDLPERLREFGEDRKAKIEAILKVSPEKILHSLEEIYNHVHQLEKEGLKKDEILKNIKDKKPNLVQTVNKFYGLLRSQVWGYRLGQDLIAFLLKQNLS